MANDVFTAGDLVVSIYGDGDGSGNYTDNQAAPIVLQDISTSGVVGGQLVLPQTTTVVNGVTEYAISGEYGSSSEGTLELSADGHSLTIAGYAVNAQTYNAGGAAVYGDARLAQSTSVPGGQFTPVARVIADISATGVVDTSTALFNIDNGNNPRSVATVDGSSFYIAGQGQKGDSTQGLFYVQDGASTATAINNSTDMRTVEIANGSVYVSTDSKQSTAGNKFTSNISVYNGDPTSASTPTVLPGISQSVTLTAGQANSVNSSQIGKTVNLSPENYYFANATTLYVADGGNPKGGGLGDGGLQKWVLVGSTWQLQYTISAGLNLVPDTASAGTTGLIGLTGKVVDGTVYLYATNSTIGDLDQTYLYAVTDPLAATTNPGNSFSVLETAAPGTNIRGVAFAPTDPTACYCSGTTILTAEGPVAVEALRIGDMVVTSTGAHRPIRWIGHRTVDCRNHADLRSILPVRIAAGAFGPKKPERDLFVSPGHAICVDVLGEVLIPASLLINGATITQVDTDQTTYWHVELDSHDILLADGLPAESYLDTGNRDFFVESGTVSLYAIPDAKVGADHDYCRTFVNGGALVEIVCDRLRERALQLGWTLDTSGCSDLHLVVDGVVLHPVIVGLAARFVVPAEAESVWLVSNTSVPAHVTSSGDYRVLGVDVQALTVDDGFTGPRTVALDDPLLCIGFHPVEAGSHRWTAGRARLPEGLWSGCQGSFFLRVDLAARAVARWQAPVAIETLRAPDAVAA